MSEIKDTIKRIPAIYRPILAGYKARGLVHKFREDPTYFQQLWRVVQNPDDYILCHYEVSTNFGDAISPAVVAMISGKTPYPLSWAPSWIAQTNYSVVGSVLQFPASRRTEVWGSGFISGNASFPIKPKRIHAVRGPLTRIRCIRLGVDCPEIYGDPSVIFFDKIRELLPKRKPQFKMGLVPHYADQSHQVIQTIMRNESVSFIDVRDPIEEIAQKMWDCDVIISSSLHGLILADALEIPSRWLGVSNIVMRRGFKFQDYFMSMNRREPEPLLIHDLSISRALKEAHLRITPFDRQRLLEVCPF